jgi:hypothetical protein
MDSGLKTASKRNLFAEPMLGMEPQYPRYASQTRIAGWMGTEGGIDHVGSERGLG